MLSRMSFAVVVLLISGCAGSLEAPSASPSPGAPAAETPGAAEEPGAQAPVAPETGAAGDQGARVPGAPETGAAAEAPTADEGAVPVAALYTEAQARRGQRAFRQVCSDCHYTSEFKGPVFTDAWARRTARDFYRELRRTMPDDNPGGLPRQTYVDVMAYILELNGYPAGPDELPPDDEILGGFRLTPPGTPGPGRQGQGR